MFRKTIIAFLVFVLTPFLLLTALSATAVSTFTTSNAKKWLKDDGVYQTVIDAAIKQNTKLNIGSEAGQVTLTDVGVQTIIKKTFTPEFLQKTTETILDSTQLWLDGKVKVPNFQVDLSQIKSSLATNLGDFARQRYASLPVCAAGQLPSSTDVLSVNCQVKGLNIEPAVQKLTSDIQNNPDFLAQTTLNADTINEVNNKDGTPQQPLFEKLHNVPKTYKWVRISPYIFGLLSLLAIAGILLLSSVKRKGFRRVAVSLLVVGILLVASVELMSYGFSKVESQIRTQDSSTNVLIKNTVLPVLNSVKNSLNQHILIFGITFLVLSLGTLTYLFATRNKKPSIPKKSDSLPSAEKPVAKPPSSRPNPPLIQG